MSDYSYEKDDICNAFCNFVKKNQASYKQSHLYIYIREGVLATTAGDVLAGIGASAPDRLSADPATQGEGSFTASSMLETGAPSGTATGGNCCCDEAR